jgi:hypothetical protein
VGGVFVAYYGPLAHGAFLRFLKDSQPECMVTGDQSFFEALSMKKVVLYDALPHKYKLLDQVVDMFTVVAKREQPEGKEVSKLHEKLSNYLVLSNEYDAVCAKNVFKFWKANGRLYIYKESPTESLQPDRAVIAIEPNNIYNFLQKNPISLQNRGC